MGLDISRIVTASIGEIVEKSIITESEDWSGVAKKANQGVSTKDDDGTAKAVEDAIKKRKPMNNSTPEREEEVAANRVDDAQTEKLHNKAVESSKQLDNEVNATIQNAEPKPVVSQPETSISHDLKTAGQKFMVKGKKVVDDASDMGRKAVNAASEFAHVHPAASAMMTGATAGLGALALARELRGSRK